MDKRKLKLKHLYVLIGSKCYADMPVQKQRKMEQKAIKGALVGYDYDEHCRIWLKEQNTVILSIKYNFSSKI